MRFFTLIPYYLVWHYTNGILNYLSIWGNFIWFSYNYFSFKVLLKTLFSPFKRLSEKNFRGFDPGKFFGDLIVNILMRIIGFMMRIGVILIGVAVTTIVVLGGLGLFIVWLVLPLFLGFCVIAGLIAVFK
jgi:hypothetical protein